MMISPSTYLELKNDMPFEELIKERAMLLEDIQRLEVIVFDEERSDEAWEWKPGPDVQYQMELEYLAKLCNHMKKKINAEYEN